MLLYTDEASGCVWPFFAKVKSDFAATVPLFKSEVGVPLTLRSDNAPDLIHGQFDAQWKEAGVRPEVTARAAPHQNGKCERALATLMADCRTLLSDTGLPDALWPYALSTAAISRNPRKTTPARAS